MEELEKLKLLPSYDWSLEMLADLGGLHIVLQWNDDEPQYMYPGFSWIHFFFVYPASWAHWDYSQMWQYVPDSPVSAVLKIEPHIADKTHVPGITLNTEICNSGWLNYQIVACDNAVNIIDREPPEVRLSESRPPMIDWWAQGRPVI